MDFVLSPPNILNLDQTHRELFSNTPMVSFRRTKSLKDILVRAIVKSQTDEPNICQGCNGRSDCAVCKILIHSEHFHNKNKTRTYDLRKGTLNCNSTKVVYLMTCNFCQKQYVGKSLPKFRERYNNYKTKFRKRFFSLTL